MDAAFDRTGNSMYRTMRAVCDYERMIRGKGIRLDDIFNAFEQGYKGFQDPANPVHDNEGSWDDWKINVRHFAESMEIMEIGKIHSFVDDYPWLSHVISSGDDGAHRVA